MPARTNKGQEIVALLRLLIAGDPTEIEESALLEDRVTGDRREVDVVWRPRVQDLVMTVSFEVIDWQRPAAVTWVEQQINKHATLETDRLVLVSWSGFSSAARRKATSNPNVLLVAPEAPLDGDAATTRQLRTMETALTPSRVVASVKKPDGMTVRIPCPADIVVFDDVGAEIGHLRALTMAILTTRAVMERTLADARQHPTPEQLVHFVLRIPLSDAHMNLRWETPLEYHRLLELEVSGEIVLKDRGFDIAVTRFRDIVFGFGSTTILDRDALLVARIGETEAIAGATLRVYAEGAP